MTQFKSIARLTAILAVVLIAWTFRARAVNNLPVDYDEDDYLRAGQEFAHLFRTGNWSGFLDTNYRYEHPPLAKILYGLSILPARATPLIPDRPTTASPDPFLPKEQLHDARTLGNVLGTLTVLLLAWVNPLGGLYLAVHTFTIKYVSQVMIESLPALTSFIAILAYIQSKKKDFNTPWLLTSAIFLGLTVASKYLYSLVAIAILVDWGLAAKQHGTLKFFPRQVVIWGMLAVLIFFAADPYLWPDPIGRLKESILYHAAYSISAQEVQQANLPFWQPLIWLSKSPVMWHENVFYFAPDLYIALLAILGLRPLWTKERIYVLWLGIAILFLLFWPTKWPQYILTLTVPLSLSAAEGTLFLWKILRGGVGKRKDSA